MLGWSVAIFLLAASIGLAIYTRRVKGQLRRERAKVARLTTKVAAVRQSLAEVKSRRKKSFAAATEAMIIVEKDYTISSTNKVARKMFGKPGKGITLMTWTRQHRLQELVAQALQGIKTAPIRFTMGSRTLEAHSRSVKVKKQVVAVALAINDVTQLQYLSRARRDFVANISHELRTPLASIQLLTETLLNGALEDKKMAVNLVDKIASQIDTLRQLAQELLDLSLIESGQAPLKLASYSLKEIVAAQLDRQVTQARRKGIVLDNEIDDSMVVLVDEAMIGRVISNLVHNAIKYTASGRVTISAQNGNETRPDADDETDIQWVTVSVSDTGVGIPPDEIGRIFERFYVVDRARNQKKSGTGLGLAIAKHIIEAHGGQIWAKSDGRAGTTFSFTVPAELNLPVNELALASQAA